MKFLLSVVGTEGTMEISRLAGGGYRTTLLRPNEEAKGVEFEFTGVEGEVRQFLQSIRAAKEVAIADPPALTHTWTSFRARKTRVMAPLEPFLKKAYATWCPT